MPRTLDPTHLRSLVAISDAGGFTRAAATLHISQSTVSEHVRQLERTVGVPLVKRHGRSSRFTGAGEQLLAEARHILAVHDGALARLKALSGAPLVIGATETVADQVLPTVLAELRAAFPERPVQFVIDRSTQMLEQVEKGVVDLAVVLSSQRRPEGRVVGEFELGWYAAPSWRLPGAGGRFPLVAYTEPCGMRQRALSRLGATGIVLDVTAEATSLEGVIAAARAGLGVAVLPTAGAHPSGLVRIGDLPSLGSIDVVVAPRRGVESEFLRRVEGTLADVLTALRAEASA